MDNKFFVFMGRVADLMILNLLCVLCCIPIVTAGASITAMFYVTLKMVRNEESYVTRGFFKSFKENFRQATIIHLIMLAIGFFLIMDVRITSKLNTTISRPLMVVFIAFIFLYLLVFLYIYPVLSKFYNSIRQTFINAFLMAIRHLPYTILMLLVSASPILVLYIPYAQIQSILMLLLILMGAGVVAYVNSIFFVRIFDNYIPKEPEASEDESLEALPAKEEL